MAEESQATSPSSGSALPVQEPAIIELAADALDAELEDPTRMQRYECRSCGYSYEPTKGDQQGGIAAGIPFEELPDSWKCPVCSASAKQFEPVGVKGKPSGFKENLGYGLGVNVMTPGQKNILIFAALMVGFLFLMSFYFVE
jgi:rubredoxin